MGSRKRYDVLATRDHHWHVGPHDDVRLTFRTALTHWLRVRGRFQRCREFEC